MKNNYIKQGWLILFLAVLFGVALAGVQRGLDGRIQANKKADTMSQLPNLTPGAVSGELGQYGDLMAYKTVNKAGEQVGWVLQASGQGFADKIEVLIGLNTDASDLTGLYVLFQNETPGLGNKIVASGPDSYRAQFSGKSTKEPLVVTKNGDASPDNNKIDAITGATISSQSTVDIVNSAVHKFKVALAGQEDQ
ncbi:MAG: FMN-binding protein [Kiritimatiellae bacterium]|nr:FMN-binding protein [Kiritimatiellia bacterium]